MKKLLLYFIVTLNLCYNLFSETLLNTMDDIVKAGRLNNLDYLESLIDLEDAENGVVGYFKLDTTSFSVGSTDTDIEEESWELNTSFTMPVSDQITLSGSMTDQKDGSVGISISPLNHSSESQLSKINFNNQKVITKQAELQSEISAVTAALGWMSSKKKMELQSSQVELYDNIYSDDKRRYQEGDITLDDLKDSLVTWSESRKTLLETEQNYKDARIELYSALGIDNDDLKLFTVNELNDYLNKLKESIDKSGATYLSSSNYIKSIYSVNSAKVSYDNTWSYDPEITASGNIEFEENEKRYGASITFKVALDDFQKRERAIMKKKYELSLLEQREIKSEEELKFAQQLDILDSNEINTTIYNIELEQALLLKSEAELLYKNGEYSQLELKESELYVTESEINLFDSLTQEYISLLEFKEYIK